MKRIVVTVTESKAGHLDIVKEDVESKKATEIEKAVAGAILAAVQERIDDIMAQAEECGASTSKEVRHG